MPLRVDCTCGKSFAAPDHLAGARVACPSCGHTLSIAAPQAPRASELDSLLDEALKAPALSPSYPGGAVATAAAPLGTSAKARKRRSLQSPMLSRLYESPLALMVAGSIALQVICALLVREWAWALTAPMIGGMIVWLNLVARTLDEREEYRSACYLAVFVWFVLNLVTRYFSTIDPLNTSRLDGVGSLAFLVLFGFAFLLFWGMVALIALICGYPRAMGGLYLVGTAGSTILTTALLAAGSVEGFDGFPSTLAVDEVVPPDLELLAETIGPPDERGDITHQMVRLELAEDEPGGESPLLQIYRPIGSFQPRSLPCVIATGSNGTGVTGARGMRMDEPLFHELARHGYVVIVHGQDGKAQEEDEFDRVRNIKRFALSRAGLVNAARALRFALQKVPEIDPERVAAVGMDTAGTEALLLAAHDSRIRACMVFAPRTNLKQDGKGTLQEKYGSLVSGFDKWLDVVSPVTHADRIQCPLLMYHAADDYIVPLDETMAMASQMENRGRDVTMVRADTGGHWLTLGNPRVDECLKWLDDRMKPPAEVLAKLKESRDSTEAAAPSPEFAQAQMEQRRVLAEAQARANAASSWSAADFQAESKARLQKMRDDSLQDELERRAEHALRTGEWTEGRDSLYANLINREDTQLVDKLRVCNVLKRPVLNIFWTMGVETSPLGEEADMKNQRAAQALAASAQATRSSWNKYEVSRDFNDRTGTAGMAVAQAISQRARNGQFGDWGTEPPFDRDEFQALQLVPAGSTDFLLASARHARADLLVAANIQIRGGGRTPDATMVFRILDVTTARELWRGEKLTTGRVAAARRRGEVDPALAIAEAVIEFIDKNAVLKPVPALAPDVARTRASKVAAGEVPYKLGALAELAYYERKGWISRDEYEEFCVTLLGKVTADLLISADADQRRKAFKSLIQSKF